MSHLLLDTSVVVKWFHEEADAVQATALRRAHVGGTIEARILDLALYELGNVLVRALRWPPEVVAAQLDDLLVILGAPLQVGPDELRSAAQLADEHGLTFYDAAWAAAARSRGMALVSADRQLIGAGLAVSLEVTADAFGSG